ncbi:MAG: DciA family protein [Clostridia bacterium]
MSQPRRLPSKIDRILSADAELQPLLSKARELRALAGLVDGFFPPDLARQVRVGNFREGELVLGAANPAVAAKIKLLAPSLSRFLGERRWHVTSVLVRVQPTLTREPKPLAALQKNAKFSTSGLAALRSLYDTLGDSPARRALGELLARQGATGRGAAPRKEEEGTPAPRRGRP